MAGRSKGGAAAKRKADDEGKKAVKRGKKAGKDPNRPKRPPSAFFVFMEEFRKQYKEKNPKNKLVSVVSKAGGDKWKSMSDSEKAPYVAKAEKRKADYLKNIAAYDKKKAEGSSGGNASSEEAGEGSDKSKSEVEDDEQESGEEDEDEDDD
ncbi:HMG1/2-like protein [Ananas comosus]|uniref:HMG1/2-like protein n=1 Tax=Ananas comosus TaxID=4615 RepID=A0A6P5EK70_ANACO|nr:HMG1/2-like protein [Ananas comosus]XP_020083817.1 HMG1/2-like protein [Ananas comosus]